MDSSDSLNIDENLARFLAAYDQSIDGGDSEEVTLHVPMPTDSPLPGPDERLVTPLRGDAPNEGSLGEVLPDSHTSARMRPPLNGYTPPGTAGGSHRIGRFELRRQLGKGGCGIVFLAYDPKLQREVALKIPRPEMVLNPDAKSRLRREALAAAEFDHPNLVPVYETGEIGPLCFIATAFCPGQTLAEWHDRQAFPVPVRQAARLVAIVAEAVQHAHDRGVLHRDLKPNNVILQEMKVEENDEPPPGSVQLRGVHYVPRLVDFGLAKLLERGGPSETATRQILGTPKYMAPEQAQARREDIGPPADVYALGVILYELLAGRAPYEGETDVEVLRQAIEGTPTPPRALRPDLPRDLEAICLKAMSRTTTARYRTAIDLADDLRRFLDGKPTLARPLAWPGRAGRWLRRNDQIVAIVVLAIIVVFVSGLSSSNWYLSRQLRKDHDTVLSEQAQRNRSEQEWEYSRQIREAFLAWRGGNTPASNTALESARRAATLLMEQPDFTHDYLKRLNQSADVMIVCPAGAVTALAVTPDGTRLASGHTDGTVAIWDRATGTQLASVQAHDADVTQLAFALDGSLLLTVGKEQGTTGAFGWRVGKSGELTRAPAPYRVIGTNVACIAVTPDGDSAFAGSQSGAILRVHLRDPKQSLTLTRKSGAVTAVVVSVDGKTVVTAHADNTLRRWNPNLTPKAERSEFRVVGKVTALDVGEKELPVAGFADGRVLVLGSADRRRELSTGSRVHWIVAASGERAIANGLPGRVRIGAGFDLATGDTGDVRTGATSRDGKTLFTAGPDGVIRSWSLPVVLRERAACRAGRVVAISVADNGENIVVADAIQVKRIDGAAEGKVVAVPQPFAVVRVLADRTVRGVYFEDHSAVVCDLIWEKCTERMRVSVSGNRSATGAALTPDGARLAVGDDAGYVTIWSVTDRTVVGTIDTGVRQPVRRVALSDDGTQLAAPSASGIAVWTIANPEIVTRFDTDGQAVFRFLPARDRFLTAGRDGVVRIWNIAGREQSALFGHVGRVTGVGVSPDGRTLVSGDATGEVKLWDIRTGQELLGLRRHSTPVTVIEFAASGKLLVTGGDGQFAIWDAR